MTNDKEKLITCKLLNAHESVSNLLISLLGETSFFLKINVEGTKFVVIPESLLSLPSHVALKMDKIAQMSTNIKNIENWKKEFIGVDCIKRAFIEAISELFNDYLNLVDILRMDHISNKNIAQFNTIMSFVIEWQDRISYLHRLTEAAYNKCGMELMNMVFLEWTMQCIADWTYNLLEKALERMSISFHKLVISWLLDGKINFRINWMIREERKNDAHSQNSSNNVNISLLDNGNLTSNKTTSTTFLSLYERVSIDWNFVPVSLNSCHGIIKKIFDIGRNVNFLRELRHQKNYEYRLQDRTKLLEDEQINKKKLWYSVAERGRLYSMIQQYSEIVNEDLLNEIMIKQRLLDHISFVQVHFFLLNGDFNAAIYEAIRDSPVKNRLLKKNNKCNELEKFSPFHNFQRSSVLNRNFSHPDFMAQACITYAFNFTSQLKSYDGLKQYMVAEKVHNASSSITYLEDLVRLNYKPLPAIFPALNDQMIQIYNLVFKNVVQYRVLHGRIDEVAINLSNVLRVRNQRCQKQNKKQLNNTYLENVVRFVQYCIFVLRNFTATLLTYFYNEVFEPKCKNSLKKMRAQPDLQYLISTHMNFLNSITSSLFLTKSSKRISELLRQSIKLARRLVKAIDEFVIVLENTETTYNSLYFKNLSKQEVFDKKSDDLFTELNNEQLLDFKLFLLECYNNFMNNLCQLRITFEDVKILNDNSHALPHWQNFEIPIFFSFVN